MKLRTKFSLSTFFLVTSILCGVAVFLFLAEKRHLENKLYEQLDTDIHKFEKICKESLLTRQDITLLNYAATMKQAKTIAAVMLMDPSGKILMHSDLTNRGLYFKSPVSVKAAQAAGPVKFRYRDAAGEPIFEIAVPVMLGAEKAGIARIAYFQRELGSSVSLVLRDTAIRIGKVAAVGIIFGIVISYLLVLSITGPIRKLAEGARIIGEGKLDHRIDIRSSDELGALSADFNQMAAKLAELDKMKDEFVDTVSHELRSPLAAIRGYAQSLKRGIYGPLNQKQGEAVDVVMDNSIRLGKFIDDVLDMAKIRAGMMELDRAETDLAPVAREIVTMFTPLATEMGVSLAVDVPADLPKVFADPGKIKQVITNLTSNSMKFTPQGGTVSFIAQVVDDGWVRAGIKDTGIGIPQDKLGSVFEKFSQVKEAQQTSKKIKGTGLGLTIAKQIVEMHGGRIWVESEEGKGTTFFFTLPRNAPPLAEGTIAHAHS